MERMWYIMKKFRPTAVPLVTVDPFLSIWSFSDKLYDDWTRHWTGKRSAMTGLIEVDKIWYRFMGRVQADNRIYYEEPQVIPQTSVTVDAMDTSYTFENDILRLELKFTSPLCMDDLDLMSRPVSYISYKVKFKDGAEHNVRTYFDICSEICVDKTSEKVRSGQTGYSVFCGKGEKDVLAVSGDDVTISWGNLHLIQQNAEHFCVTDFEKRVFFKDGTPLLKDFRELTVADDYPSICSIKEYKGSCIEDFLCVGYDDIYSIEYFGKKLKGYWQRNGATFGEAAEKAVSEYPAIMKKTEKFNRELEEKALQYGGKYRDILCLVYRQVMAAHKLVEDDGRLLYFSKECLSNGCIATVDITYPSMPLFLIYNPNLIEGMLNPIFEYAVGNHGWNYDFAPHDVGQYPLANGQVYGYDIKTREMKLERQMPVEECGNMILCVAALCEAKKDFSYAQEHKAILGKWAEYLKNNGYDSESQLCTDDFAGHLAHNCNLSVKLILALAAWGKILKNLNDEAADKYTDAAKEYAKEWMKNADDGNHYRLAFDKPDTWSIKYNLVWDKILELNVFDNEVFKKEVDFYKTKMNKYGIPLDCRSDYTKSDWQMWTVCLTDDEEYRVCIIDRMWDMICDIRERVPFSDWYYTSENKMEQFQNRTVQGGLFLPIVEI